MTYKPFLFKKSYEERLDDFKVILGNNLKARDIEKQWSSYLELAIEPVGWQAIWRISRDLCADFKINFPCTAVVIVEHVNFKELSCVVAVSELDNDGQLPDKLADVPLVNLYPTIEQDETIVLKIYETASLIDSLRFFYHNLWMPWDLQFDEYTPWIDAHLVGRLQLHFSVLELKVPEELVYKVRSLVAEGRKTILHIEDLQDAEVEIEQSPTRMLELTELHNLFSQLRNTYSIYENPFLLQALIERHQNCKDSKTLRTVVVSMPTPEQLCNIGTQLPVNAQQIRLVSTLQEGLVKTPQEGTLYVTKGEHVFQDLAGLRTGGSIIGLDPGVVLVGDASGDDCAALDLLKGCLTMSRVTLRMISTWTIMKVRPNTKSSLNDVQLHGSIVTDGVDVYPNATFSAVGCAFNSCHTALVCYPNSTVSLTRCIFINNSVAIELREGCHFTMTDCLFSGSSICAVKILQPSPLIKGDKQPLIETINSIPHLKESGTIYKGNALDIKYLQTAGKDQFNGDRVENEEKQMNCTY